MNFLVDNHLPIELVRWFESKDHKATHVRDVQLNRAQDVAIWNYAAQNSFVIVTKDEDFADLVLLRSETVSVVWLHIGNCRKQTLIKTLDAAWLQTEQKLKDGERIIEIY